MNMENEACRAGMVLLRRLRTYGHSREREERSLADVIDEDVQRGGGNHQPRAGLRHTEDLPRQLQHRCTVLPLRTPPLPSALSHSSRPSSSSPTSSSPPESAACQQISHL